MMKEHLNTQAKINAGIAMLAGMKPNGEYKIEIKRVPKTRTKLQNRALHQYFQMLADALNDKNITMQKLLEMQLMFEIVLDADIVKRQIWKPLQKTIIGHDKTSKATREDYAKVYDPINLAMIEQCDVYVPWPTKESMK